MGQGAYVLPEDRVKWPGALHVVQSQLELEVHAGGKTVLELKGYSHYVPTETRTVFLYAQPKAILPAWFSGERFVLNLVVTRTGLFPGNSREGFSEWKEREFFWRVKSRLLTLKIIWTWEGFKNLRNMALSGLINTVVLYQVDEDIGIS